jgi:multidrug efflux pump subunit AcrB
MTALAMMIGMVPMALSLQEAGEQNAPLARAVIGGLFLATIATLFFVPCVFAMLRSRGAGLQLRRQGDSNEPVLLAPALR